MEKINVNWTEKADLVDDMSAKIFNNAFKSIQEGFDNTKKEIDDNKESAEKEYAKKSELPTKTTLGLDKVDNTPDNEKSVLYAQSAGIAQTADCATMDRNGNDIVDTYATKNGIVDTYATKNELSTVESIAKGANQAITFDNYQSMIVALNSVVYEDWTEDPIKHFVGQNILIKTLNVPDLWISAFYENPEEPDYVYTTDEDLVNALITNGSVMIKYVQVSMLETQKVDLTEYATKKEVNSVSEKLDEVDAFTQTLDENIVGVQKELEYINNEITDVKAELGDIETALDNIIAEQEAIIAIQNSLIGGDNV